MTCIFFIYIILIYSCIRIMFILLSVSYFLLYFNYFFVSYLIRIRIVIRCPTLLVNSMELLWEHSRARKGQICGCAPFFVKVTSQSELRISLDGNFTLCCGKLFFDSSGWFCSLYLWTISITEERRNLLCTVLVWILYDMDVWMPLRNQYMLFHSSCL